VGHGLLRLCVGWGWSAAAISCVLRGSPFLTSFNAGARYRLGGLCYPPPPGGGG
jgi:hypothetical protein